MQLSELYVPLYLYIRVCISISSGLHVGSQLVLGVSSGHLALELAWL